jgi:DnaK suppressor protein
MKINLAKFRQNLERQRQDALEFLGRLGCETRSLASDRGQDSADLSVLSVTKESLFEQGNQRRKVLRLVERALLRIRDGSFGTCDACGDDIQRKRLEAVPWTQLCLRCQEEREGNRETSFSAGPGQRSNELWRRAG